MIQVITTPDYERNSGNVGIDTPCAVCGRGIDVKLTTPHLHMNIDWQALLPGEESDLAELASGDYTGEDGILYGPFSFKDVSPSQGNWPIGADCLRKHPELKPYII